MFFTIVSSVLFFPLVFFTVLSIVDVNFVAVIPVYTRFRDGRVFFFFCRSGLSPKFINILCVFFLWADCFFFLKKKMFIKTGTKLIKGHESPPGRWYTMAVQWIKHTRLYTYTYVPIEVQLITRRAHMPSRKTKRSKCTVQF